MKRSIIFSCVAVLGMLVLTACPSTEDPVIYSTCVQDIIDSLALESTFSPSARVEEWKVGNETYIYSTSDCCDHFNFLLNLECEVICAPDGGFSGMGDGNCPNLEGVEKMLIWEDPR